MDISKASNFERFVFDLVGRDAARTMALFGADIAREGGFQISDAEFARIAGFGFASGKSLHADRITTIRDTWQRFGTMIDTHTADGLKVAREQRRAGVPMLVMETALPAKFAETIREALDIEPPRPAALLGIEALPKRLQVLPVDAERVKRYIAEHTGL
jgi:threonine synthase